MRSVIIAEAGVNHNGDIGTGIELIRVAAKAGADFVKFQSFKAENLVTQSADMANYQKKNSKEAESQFSMLRKLEMTSEMMAAFVKECEDQNISFLSTAFDETAADFLVDYVDFFKIPSGELTNLPYLRHIARLKKPIVLSTGMATLAEIESSVREIKAVWKDINFNQDNFLLKNGCELKKLTVLHCTTSYPTPFDEVNLNAMIRIGESLEVPIGYSDHTLGITIPVAARAMGARVIEKHFTLDRNMPGPDHAASLEPEELVEMVKSIRIVESSMGNGVKAPSKAEIENIPIARKSIYYASDFKQGDILTENMLAMKRPFVGESPMNIDKYIGRKLKKDVREEQILSSEDFLDSHSN